MLAWIFLLSAAAAGVALTFNGAPEAAEAAGLPAVIAIVGAMSLLYLLTLRRSGVEAPTLASRSAFAIALAAGVASALPAIEALGVWPTMSGTTSQNAPAPAIGSAAPAAVRIRRGDDGRFVAMAQVNGVALDLVIDTGAAAVLLRASDAEAAGVDVAHLSFDTAIATANGSTYVAPLRLKSIAVGPVQVDDVEAFVAKPGSLNESLLGISFLRRLRSYDLGGDFMTLRQ